MFPFKIVDNAINNMEDVTMKRETNEMPNMRKIRAKQWGCKEYVKSGTLHSVRSTWEARSYMLRVAGNYAHHGRYRATGWLCQACNLQVREDQDHLSQCEGYADLLQGRNLLDDAELVEFFRLVMARREREGWN